MHGHTLLPSWRVVTRRNVCVVLRPAAGILSTDEARGNTEDGKRSQEYRMRHVDGGKRGFEAACPTLPSVSESFIPTGLLWLLDTQQPSMRFP
jgi:hypothetical protein